MHQSNRPSSVLMSSWYFIQTIWISSQEEEFLWGNCIVGIYCVRLWLLLLAVRVTLRLRYGNSDDWHSRENFIRLRQAMHPSSECIWNHLIIHWKKLQRKTWNPNTHLRCFWLLKPPLGHRIGCLWRVSYRYPRRRHWQEDAIVAQCSLRALESMADLILDGDRIPDDISLHTIQVYFRMIH